MQALRRWTKEGENENNKTRRQQQNAASDGDEDPVPKKRKESTVVESLRPSLPQEGMSSLLQLFRKLQRWRDGDTNWLQAVRKIEEDISELCATYSRPTGRNG